MCEPHHSIVQYPVDDDPGPGDQSQPPGSQGVSENKLRWGLGKIFDWGKKIASWFHFSKLGSGHTESIEWAKTRHLILPDDVRYETQWWNRTVHLDGYGGTDESLKAATQYAHVVCIGDIQKFRRFFETSMQKSDRPIGYVDRFLDNMLVRGVKDQVNQQLIRVFGKDWKRTMCHTRLEGQQIISMLMGFTRQRKLLVPEWADDNKLWVPSTQIVGG